MIYVISDLHIGHNQPFIYEVRGYKSVEEHDAAIINNINSVVREDDTLYILGDLAMGDIDNAKSHLENINCRNVKFIIGNHDTTNRIKMYEELGFENLGYATMLKCGKKHFYLSHYPTRTANYDDDKVWNRVYNLCGHSHTSNKFDDIDMCAYHVDVESHNCTPISMNEIIEDLRKFV